jgi:hypothetical protein
MRNRRAHYRIVYPVHERPWIVYGTSISEVTECSERGLRFRTVGSPLPAGTALVGRLGMRHGQEVRFGGSVIWGDEQTTALHLDRAPIPFLAMMREQMYLRHAALQTQ